MHDVSNIRSEVQLLLTRSIGFFFNLFFFLEPPRKFIKIMIEIKILLQQSDNSYNKCSVYLLPFFDRNETYCIMIFASLFASFI